MLKFIFHPPQTETVEKPMPWVKVHLLICRCLLLVGDNTVKLLNEPLDRFLLGDFVGFANLSRLSGVGEK